MAEWAGASHFCNRESHIVKRMRHGRRLPYKSPCPAKPRWPPPCNTYETERSVVLRVLQGARRGWRTRPVHGDRQERMAWLLS